MKSTDSFSLAGQYALVIGGTSGIGKAIAAGYLQAGARVIIAGRHPDKLERAVAELGAHGEAFGYAADVADFEALRGLVARQLGRTRPTGHAGQLPWSSPGSSLPRSSRTATGSVVRHRP
jgi:NAD(P)-dependent dehydrogenase (short-subunit alcohol dehydrogenase family)